MTSTTSTGHTPRTAATLLQRLADRRREAQAVRSWRLALSRATTPAALAEIEFLHDRVR